MDIKSAFDFLTTHVKETADFDEQHFDLVTILVPEKAEREKLTKRLTKRNLHDVNGFGALCDALADRILYPSIKKELMQFFQKVHTNQFVYKDKNDVKPLQVVEVLFKYHFYHTFYIVAQPLELFYDWDKTDDIHTHIKVDYEHIEEQLEKLLKFLHIDDSDYKENYNLLWADEVNEVEYKFSDLAVKAWKTVKKETNSNVLGFMMEGTGIHDTINLDTGDDANFDEDIIDYVKEKGLNLEPRED